MAISSNGATITLDATNVASVRSLGLPVRGKKEIDITTLSDSIETFTASNLDIAAEMSVTILIDPQTMSYSQGDSGAFVITFPKQVSGSVSGMTWAFSGVIREIETSELSSADDAAIEETLNIRLTSVVTVTNEA